MWRLFLKTCENITNMKLKILKICMTFSVPKADRYSGCYFYHPVYWLYEEFSLSIEFYPFQTLYKTQVKELREEVDEKTKQMLDMSNELRQLSDDRSGKWSKTGLGDHKVY